MLTIAALIAALQLKVACLQSAQAQLNAFMQAQRMVQIVPMVDLSNLKAQCTAAGIEVSEKTFPNLFISPVGLYRWGK